MFWLFYKQQILADIRYLHGNNVQWNYVAQQEWYWNFHIVKAASRWKILYLGEMAQWLKSLLPGFSSLFTFIVLQYNKQHIIPLENVKLQSMSDEGSESETSSTSIEPAEHWNWSMNYLCNITFPDLRNGWQIISPSKSFTVYAATATEKSEWMAHISKCVQDLLTKRKYCRREYLVWKRVNLKTRCSYYDHYLKFYMTFVVQMANREPRWQTAQSGFQTVTAHSVCTARSQNLAWSTDG